MTNNFDAYDAKRKVKSIEDFDGQFDDIIPFDLITTPEIPCDLLPDIIGNHAKDISTNFSVPEALTTMTALGIISCALNKKFVVCPKADWQEPVNVYILVGMPPGSTKSPVLKNMIKPIEEWEAKKQKEIAPKREDAKTKLKLLNLKLKKVEKDLKGSAPESEAKAQKDYEEYSKLIYEAEQSIPVIPKLYANNVTPEALEQYIFEQDNRFAVITDEGGIVETLSGLYNKGSANIDALLKGIDGGSVRVKRMNREYTITPHLSLLLVVQPQILINMGGKRSMTGNGLLERFLYVLPYTKIGHKTFNDEKLDDFLKTQYSNQIHNALNIEVPEEPHRLILSSKAQHIWEEFYNSLQVKMRPNGDLHCCAGWASKLAGYALRIAGLFHVIEHLNVNNLQINDTTMTKAIQMADLLSVHTLSAFDFMALDEPSKDAQDLLEWIKANNSESLTKAQVTFGMRNRNMGKKERLSKALQILVDRNFISAPHMDGSTKNLHRFIL